MTNDCTSIEYPPNVSAVLTILNENEISYKLATFEAPARQASQAAALVGCPLGAIVKSLVFEKTVFGELLLVLVSGQNQADINKISALVGEPVQPAKPETVLARTGYPVGAVPPLGLQAIGLVVVDEELLLSEQVWASAGAENMLFQINPIDLVTLVNGQVNEIKRS